MEMGKGEGNRITILICLIHPILSIPKAPSKKTKSETTLTLSYPHLKHQTPNNPTSMFPRSSSSTTFLLRSSQKISTILN
jgi:hypothetical protein